MLFFRHNLIIGVLQMNMSFSRFFKIVSLLFVPGFAIAQTAEVTYVVTQAVPVFGSGIVLLLGLALFLTGWTWLKKNPGSSYSKLVTGIMALGMLASVTSGGWLVSNANAVIVTTTYLFSENASPVIVSSFPATLENDLSAPATLQSIDVTGCKGIAEITGSCAVGMTLAEVGGNCSLDSVCNDPVFFTVGGTVSGLTGTGLALQNNGADTLAVAAAATAFTFAAKLTDLSTYVVTVSTQPTGQTCSVTGGDDSIGGGAIAGADVTSVVVTCVDVVTCTDCQGTVRHTDGTTLGATYELCGTGDPGTCDAAAAKSACQAIGMKVVSHASDGTSEVFSLGATLSCQWSTSYFTVDVTMPTDSCLVGVSNLEWSSCCGTSSWHGNTMPFGNPGEIFGYVETNNSGYVSGNPNITGSRWGCYGEGTSAENNGSCTTQFVACTP